MNENYSIERITNFNFEELIELTKTYYTSGDIIDPNYLKWQYIDNPAGQAFLFVARQISSNAIAGQYLVIPIRYMINGKVILGSLSLNTLTHPEHQGKGLFTKLASETYDYCSEQEVKFTIGFPNPNSFPGFIRKLHFTHLGDPSLSIKFLRPFSSFFKVLKKTKVKHGGQLPFESIQSNDIQQFDLLNNQNSEIYDTFWQTVQSQYSISTNKDFAFMQWRYAKIPTRNYKVFAYVSGKTILGLIVMKFEHVWNLNAGIVMDLLVINNDPKIGKALLNFVVKSSKKSNMDIVLAMHTKMGEYNLLTMNRFYTIPKKVLPQKTHFIYRPHVNSAIGAEMTKLENWKLTFGDYDVF